MTVVNKGNIKPEFYLAENELDFDLLAIEEIGEYFKYLGRHDLDNGQRLLLSLVKFLKNALNSFKWLSTTPKSHALFLLSVGSIEVDDESIQLVNGTISEKFRERTVFNPAIPDESSISIGGRVSNLNSLLTVLGELFVSGASVNWPSVYSPPSRYVQLPTYKFNRQTVWFSEKKPVYDHPLIGTETRNTEKGTQFENQLSLMRHPAIFKHGFSTGDAVLAVVESARQRFSSGVQIRQFNITAFKPEQAVWLETTVEFSGDTAQVIGKAGNVDIFQCSLEKNSTQPNWKTPSSSGEGKVLFVEQTPSTVVKVFGELIEVNAVYDCSYRALFYVLEKRGYKVENLELTSFCSLEKRFIIKNNGSSFSVGTEEGLCLEIRSTAVPVETAPVEREIAVVERTVEEVAVLEEKVEKKETTNGFEKVRDRIKKALVDVLAEEIIDDTQGFMEMGMDSLTLVDFVNRLNEKYFPDSEISTTDIFDHPSLNELAFFMAPQTGVRQLAIPEEAKEDVKPVAELLLGKGRLEVIKTKICQALHDVLPEEPEDLTAGFMEMGMDSLTLVDFVNRLNEKYFAPLEISTTDVFDNPTVAELSQDIMTRVSGSEEPLKINVDSGIGCSGEVSPGLDGEETLEDAFFFVNTSERRTSTDFKLVVKDGKLVIRTGKEELAVSENNIDKLKKKGSLSVELEDGQIGSEELFTSLIALCKQLEKAEIQVDVVVPDISSASQQMGRAFMKTAAAEKPLTIRYVWAEQLQRKTISKEELCGKIGGFWLITGGLSGIGLSAAKWLGTEGVEGVALLSRRTPDERLAKELEEMRKTAQVLVISADITDEEKLLAELRSLQKLDGVIHCAGLLQASSLLSA